MVSISNVRIDLVGGYESLVEDGSGICARRGFEKAVDADSQWYDEDNLQMVKVSPEGEITSRYVAGIILLIRLCASRRVNNNSQSSRFSVQVLQL